MYNNHEDITFKTLSKVQKHPASQLMITCIIHMSNYRLLASVVTWNWKLLSGT